MPGKGWAPFWGDPFPTPADWSLADQLRALPDEDIDRILGALTNEERASLAWAWEDFWLRPDVRAESSHVGTGQRPPPGEWIWWVNQGGRGSGKTHGVVIEFANEAHRMGADFVGVVLCENDEEARKLIDDPKSGMRAILPPWKRPEFNPSVGGGLLTFPSGAVAHVVSAEKPSKGRGGNFNRWLIDDPPKFGQQGKAIFDALRRAFRLQGHGLRAYIATTPPGNPPPRCPELLEELLAAQFDPTKSADWTYSIAPSDANMSNLDADTKRVLASFAGTADDAAERAGVYDPQGGPRIFAGLDFTRPPIRALAAPERLDVVTISIDPADSSNTRACEVGIVAGGLLRQQAHAYLLEDASAHLNSDDWPEVAWALAERWAPMAHAWRFVIEVNRGTKDSSLLRAREVIRRLERRWPHVGTGEGVGLSACEIRTVTSREDKGARAAPLPLVYRAGQVRHLPGLETVEAQLHRLTNAARQQTRLDRADAAVYVLLDLFGLIDGHAAPVLGASTFVPVGAFGARALDAIAVAPPAPAPLPSAAPGVTMRMPGTPVGAFGRSSW